MVNHSPKPNTIWNYDTASSSLRIWSLDSIAEGQEVTTSYGDRTNPRLFSTYGFTIDPEHEPGASFRLWSFYLARFYPNMRVDNFAVDLQFTTDNVLEGFAQVFMEAAAQDLDGIRILNDTLGHFLRLRKHDPLLMPFIENLERNREVGDVQDHIWWTRGNGSGWPIEG